MPDIFNDYRWHSIMEPTEGISKKRIIHSLPVKAATLARFIRVSKDGSFLIHKSTKALWKFSDDHKRIEPVFKDDVLTEDSL